MKTATNLITHKKEKKKISLVSEITSNFFSPKGIFFPNKCTNEQQFLWVQYLLSKIIASNKLSISFVLMDFVMVADLLRSDFSHTGQQCNVDHSEIRHWMMFTSQTGSEINVN